MIKEVDARGLTCPQPVILTKKALDENDVNEVVAIVDNITALENISKLARTLHCEASVDEKGGEYYIRIIKDEDVPEIDVNDAIQGHTVILITSNVLGRGDDKLGSMLMKSFMYTLTQMEGVLKAVIFMNSAVLLTTEGSELIEHIRALEDHGVEILSCGTCLDFYNMTDKLRVGQVSNMYTIVDKMLSGDKVINL